MFFIDNFYIVITSASYKINYFPFLLPEYRQTTIQYKTITNEAFSIIITVETNITFYRLLKVLHLILYDQKSKAYHLTLT